MKWELRKRAFNEPMSRPSWNPSAIDCDKAREMASRGLTVAQIASCLGISETTLYKKQSEYAEFMDAIKRGRAEGINQVSNALFEKAIQGNVTAMIYYLKVRDRMNWGENQPEPLREIPAMKIVVAKT
jgi:predicted transcriptional regulator